VTEENYWYSSLEPPLDAEAVAEAKIIVDAFRRREIPVEIGGFPDCAEEDDDLHPGGIAFMYAKRHILAREQYLAGTGWALELPEGVSVTRPKGILEILSEDERVREVEITRVIGDIVRLHLNPRRDTDTPDREQPDVLELLNSIDARLGPGIAAPDHVLTAAQHLTPCSATEPQQVYPTAGPYPAACRDGGSRVRIFQADTGLVARAAETFPWLVGVYGDLDPRAGTGPGSMIRPYGGHGTFVAGVLRCMAPQAQVHVENIFDTGGSALESEVAMRLNAAFGFGFEIVHITASCHTRKNVPPLALEAWLERLRPYKGVVCVAEAGNNGTVRPSWPGAFCDVLSVGALATDWRHRADFSNYGGWVDVYAPGENLINAFGSGTYTYHVPPIPPGTGQATFSGLAQWSGTSFSAPIVTGLIAARMARCGESAREAAAALLAKARCQAIPGVGPVLFPECHGGEERYGRCGGDGGDCRCGCGRCGCGRCGHGEGYSGGRCGCGRCGHGEGYSGGLWPWVARACDALSGGSRH
jgi:Subtilase family